MKNRADQIFRYFKYLIYYFKIINDRDDFHLTLAFWADKRIDLIDFLN